ncbi:efflux RND transporter periplasmic adaptor subunit [Eubacterium limosum]|uniref:Efflux RND transporter periplasmic adaptor subunit n=1 Tax=Eubacterium limosum TaxID=1736 RepID=A0ABT5UNX2_EUBLI|nr:efflux RND transporter periplasmic adaptor subunit [Eubacterium limosum]MDE1470637.1 efflux RND transporter periplasmic adaptor subunit [Eubacterium limosum]
MKRTKQILIIVILLSVIGVMSYAYLRTNSTKPAEAAQNSKVMTADAVKKNIVQTFTSSGEIKTRRTQSLKPNTDYKFKALCTSVGQTVQEGYPVVEYTNGKTLNAPFDLVVTNAALPAKGEALTAEHTVEVSDVHNLQVQMSVFENDLTSLREDQPVSITVAALGNKAFAGKLSAINQIGKYDASGSKFTVSADFENDGSLKLGMSASCSINVRSADNVLSVPVAAIQSGEDGKYVTVKAGDGEERRKVETGISDSQDVEITSGLNEGDTVILPSAGNPSDAETPGGEMNMTKQEVL